MRLGSAGRCPTCPAGPHDVDALRRLAQRDTRALPDGELLIALVNGETRAAISLTNGETVADPFHRTEELVGMLTLRSSLLRGTTRQRRCSLKRLLGTVGSSAPSPRSRQYRRRPAVF